MGIESDYQQVIEKSEILNKNLREYLQNKSEKIHISNDEHMLLYGLITKVSNASNSSSYKGKIDYDEQMIQYFLNTIQNYLLQDYGDAIQLLDKQDFLGKVHEQFNNFAFFLHRFQLSFNFLDQFKLSQHNEDLITLGFKKYKEMYWDKLEKNKLFSVISYFHFEKLRNGETVPEQEIKTVINMYQTIGFKKSKGSIRTKKDHTQGGKIVVDCDFSDCKEYYNIQFGKQFVINIQEFYKNKIQELNKLTVNDYIQEAKKILVQELDWCKIYYPKSEQIIMEAIRKILIIDQLDFITRKQGQGLNHMFNNRLESQLADIFELFNSSDKVRQECFKTLIESNCKYFMDQGNSIINYCQEQLNLEGDQKKSQKEIALKYIKDILQLKQYSDQLIINVFKRDFQLVQSRDRAFMKFINDFTKSPFYLALFCDDFLKSTKNFSNDDEISQEIKKYMQIFIYLNQRDEFFQKYQKFFAHRLLNSTNLNDDAEKQFLSEFKTEVGSHVNILEKMYGDLSTSKIFNDLFSNKISTSFIFEIKILNINWGLLQNDNDSIQLPQAIKQCTEQFYMYYKKQYPAYKSFILFNHGTVDISLKGSDKKYLLSCTTYQMIILFHIYESGRNGLSLLQLLEKTGINKQDLEFNLFFLIKNGVCTRQNKDIKKIINEDEIINIDYKFTNKSKKLKVIPKGKLKDTEDDKVYKQQQEKEYKKIQQQRENVIDSIIVKVMKAKREFNHNELVVEAIRLITLFNPEPKMIKKQIESLIQREYLKRDEDISSKYYYVP